MKEGYQEEWYNVQSHIIGNPIAEPSLRYILKEGRKIFAHFHSKYQQGLIGEEMECNEKCCDANELFPKEEDAVDQSQA